MSLEDIFLKVTSSSKQADKLSAANDDVEESMEKEEDNNAGDL